MRDQATRTEDITDRAVSRKMEMILTATVVGSAPSREKFEEADRVLTGSYTPVDGQINAALLGLDKPAHVARRY